MKRTPLKRTQKPLQSNTKLSKGSGKLSRGKGIKKKPKTQEQLEIEQMTRDADKRFYEEVWKARGPYSEVSGTHLGNEVNKACCDHLLDKSKYPHLRYEIDNIILVTIAEHAMKTGGFPHPIHKERIEQAREKFL